MSQTFDASQSAASQNDSSRSESREPPDHYCPTPEDEREPYQTYALIPRCPWCGTDLDLRDRVSWIRECPECPYLWVPPRHT